MLAEAIGYASVWAAERIVTPWQIDTPYPYSADQRFIVPTSPARGVRSRPIASSRVMGAGTVRSPTKSARCDDRNLRSPRPPVAFPGMLSVSDLGTRNKANANRDRKRQFARCQPRSCRARVRRDGTGVLFANSVCRAVSQIAIAAGCLSFLSTEIA
jgi:hypothetical protein